MNERSKKSSGIRYPLELKKKALMELAESGDTQAVEWNDCTKGLVTSNLKSETFF